MSINQFRRHAGRSLTFLVTTIFSIIFVFPVVWLIISSLKLETELIRWPIVWLPKIPQWNNYVQLWADPRFGITKAAINSFTLSILFAVPNVFVSAFGGYAFARINAPGRSFFLSLLFATMLIPYSITIIPQFVLYSKIGLINNRLLWLLWGLGGSAYMIILFRQFYTSFPKDLDDAAEIDGANPFTTFIRIYLPNSAAPLAITFLFSFSGIWGDWFSQALFLTDKNETLAMVLATAFKNPMGRPVLTQTFAGIVLYALPLVVLYLFMQKQIVQGILTTGLKG
jgi:ABC-type glycerol-3-phosphate transport system permease component